MPKKIFKASIVKHSNLGPGVKKIVLCTEWAEDFKPGQFVHVRIGKSYDPLLRRPISISDVDVTHHTITLIYRVVGKGTALLAQYAEGDMLDCMGPLGNGFRLEGTRPLLVGGGMGLAPLIYLARSLSACSPEVLLGGRTREELFWPKMFKDFCREIHMTTDDGSVGVKGTVLDLLPQLLTEKYDMIYTCGPQPMMQGVAALAKEQHIPCQISLEKYMACGIGACLSCTCAAKDGKRRKVCTDGPVFWAEEVLD